MQASQPYYQDSAGASFLGAGAHSPLSSAVGQASSTTLPNVGAHSRQVLPDDLLLRRYRVMGSCGTGGFGTVLACWDTRLQRRVAIKRMQLARPVATTAPDSAYPATAESVAQGTVLTARMDATPTQASASTIEEALAEARTASRLTHPGIVAVHDFAVEAGIAYLVMEYVDGLNLAELLARVEGGRLTHDEAAYLVRQLGSAIAFAHREGVLHLDIKPSNIMFTRDGTVKLCDFGMATLASAAGYADARGGTVGYMPPEQVEDGMVDERTDVFGMAVSLAQALTGVSPFAAQTAEQSVALIRRGPKPRLSRLDSDLGGMAEQTLLACLSADPALRPPDASAVADDLAFGLGDPEEGEASIKALLDQLDTSVDDTEPEWDGERLPLSYRYPQLGNWTCRAATALAGGVLAYLLLPRLVLPVEVPRVAGALVVGVAGALWTPLASLAVGALLVIGVATGASASGSAQGAAVVASVAVALALLVWWASHLRDRTASLALLAASALGQPAAAPSVAAATMSPVDAAVTTALSAVVSTLLHSSLALVAQQPIPAAGLPLDVAPLESSFPLGLLRFAGLTAAGALGALVSYPHDSTGRTIAGQAVCCALVAFSQLLAVRMENDGIWPSPTWETVGVAVVLGVLVCIAVGVCGPRDADREGWN